LPPKAHGGQFSTDFTTAGAPDCQRVELSRECIMVVSNENHKKYARYAAHCLEIVHADAEFLATQREMATEWLKLAETVLHPLQPMTT
jgi:hypothetical protein